MKNLLLSLILISISTPLYSQACCSSLTPVMSTTTSGQTVTVYNNSTVPTGSGLRVDYLVNWGNGVCWGASTKTPMTYTYPCAGNYTVRLEVSVFDSSINTLCCLKTTSQQVYLTGPSHLNCSKLKASMSVTVSGDKATLIDNSTPKAWCNQRASSNIWWGTSNGWGSQTYTYKTSGTYNIRLIYELKDHIQTCRDTVDTTITVVVIPKNQIAGNVRIDTAATQPNDSLKIWLYRLNTSTNLFTAVDSLQDFSRLYIPYYFNNHPTGTYIIRTAMISNQHNPYANLPTYFFPAYAWDKAYQLQHSGGESNISSIVLKGGQANSGPGSISGTLRHVTKSGVTKTIPGMTVFLLNTAGDPVAYDITDANGNYSFGNLPIGKYTIYPDDINFTTTPLTLYLTTAQAIRTNMDFKEYANPMVIIPEPANTTDIYYSQLFSIYPNPAKNTVNINWASLSNDMAAINITDISGKKIYQSEVKMDANAAINIGNIRPGFYFLNVETPSGSNREKLLIQ